MPPYEAWYVRKDEEKKRHGDSGHRGGHQVIPVLDRNNLDLQAISFDQQGFQAEGRIAIWGSPALPASAPFDSQAHRGAPVVPWPNFASEVPSLVPGHRAEKGKLRPFQARPVRIDTKIWGGGALGHALGLADPRLQVSCDRRFVQEPCQVPARYQVSPLDDRHTKGVGRFGARDWLRGRIADGAQGAWI